MRGVHNATASLVELEIGHFLLRLFFFWVGVVGELGPSLVLVEC